MNNLGEYVNIKTGKLDANAANVDGQYPFFTCATTPLKINSYSYDCECVLVAGNGDLNVKYYNGKFDAYQRTYIIESKDSTVLKVPYLYRFLEKYVETLRNQSIGGVIKYIKLGNLTEAKIDIKDLEEQERIINILDKIDNLIEKKKQTNNNLDNLIKSRFVEMFGEPHHSNLYPYRIVKEFTNICSGGTPSRKIDSYWKEGTIRWVKTTELQNCVIYDTEEKITLEALEKSSAKLVPADTVLIAMYGQGKTRGMTGYLNVESTTNQACACILPSKEVNQKYLWRYFMMSYEELRGLAVGAGQPNLTGDMIKNFPVLMPPLELQEEYVAFAELADKSKFAGQQSIETLQTLKAKLMQDCFG